MIHVFMFYRLLLQFNFFVNSFEFLKLLVGDGIMTEFAVIASAAVVCDVIENTANSLSIMVVNAIV